MSISILVGRADGEESHASAVLFDTTTGHVLGGILRPEDRPDWDQAWSDTDDAWSHANGFLEYALSRTTSSLPLRLWPPQAIVEAYSTYCNVIVKKLSTK